MITWTEEQEALREPIEKCVHSINKDCIARDERGEFPRDGWQKLAELGLFRLPFPEAYGGLGQDVLTTMYVLEELGRCCRDGGFNQAVSTHLVSTGVPLNRFGSDALKARYLPAVCDGRLIGAHAMTEPNSGSDAMAMRTRAVLKDDRYVLNGSKTFISNAPIADLLVVYAITNPDGTALDALTAFLVDRRTPGVSVGNPLKKMGQRTGPIAEVFLDDVVVPADHIIGRAGLGFAIFNYVMKWEVLLSFVINCGEMDRRLNDCIDYVRQRKTFGQPIGKYQAVSHKLADMKIGLELARNWLYHTGAMFQRGKNITAEVAIAKVAASEFNVESALSAIRIFGGAGYMVESGIESGLRDAVAGTIYTGTNEMQRNYIAAMLGL
ncbi:MAG: acyl-CoA dehydrogenase family protein [Gammaproteobacteria bacterium]|nr:acyl-CoA dehydrogenase family protein [Gammaproteobacteria bacterium]